ncbi:uncharacterized protein LOC111045372 [Nilaparvata lugens]|uniref:uncharacterized protein LOC111045372 n=1 Tax=Nilaparvata lugens TaxID=108931 RepID=UPI00193E1AAE|nr:uncharacterized protein LOC111045372 [Nilaparvata lugens]
MEDVEFFDVPGLEDDDVLGGNCSVIFVSSIQELTECKEEIDEEIDNQLTEVEELEGVFEGEKKKKKIKTAPMCKICNKTFLKAKGFSKHMRTIHNITVKKPKLTPEDSICKICNKQFFSKSNLNAHVRIIHNPEGKEPQHKCTYCDYKSLSKSLFQRHLVRRHLAPSNRVKKSQGEEQRDWPCETCGKMFHTRANWRAHVKHVHFPTEFFQCDHCGYATSRKASFQKHMVRRHLSKTKERPYVCNECPMAAFTTRECLKRHKIKVHNMVYQSKYKKQCPHCSFTSTKLYRDEIVAHLIDVHHEPLTFEKLIFDDIESVRKWKSDIEAKTNSYYKGDVTVERTLWHNCNRSGYFDVSRQAKLSEICSTIKINAFCPAAIHVRVIDGGQVEVEYWPVHVGHSTDQHKKTFLKSTNVEVNPPAKSRRSRQTESAQRATRRSARQSARSRISFADLEADSDVSLDDPVDTDEIVTCEDYTLNLYYRQPVIKVERNQLIETMVENEIKQERLSESEAEEEQLNETETVEPVIVDKKYRIRYKCTDCEYSSTKKSSCSAHIRIRHTAVKSLGNPGDGLPTSILGKRAFSCDQCPKTVRSLSHLQAHKVCEHHHPSNNDPILDTETTGGNISAIQTITMNSEDYKRLFEVSASKTVTNDSNAIRITEEDYNKLFKTECGEISGSKTITIFKEDFKKLAETDGQIGGSKTDTSDVEVSSEISEQTCGSTTTTNDVQVSEMSDQPSGSKPVSIIKETREPTWIKALKNSSTTSMLHYKRAKVVSKDLPNLDRDDHMFIYMSRAQKDRLNVFGNKTVFVDKAYDIKADGNLHLYTLLVVGECKNVYPAVFMFTNRRDEQVLSYMFDKLRDNLGKRMVPETFMSDMDDTVYSIWKEVMGPAKSHAYSWLHVLKCWNTKLVELVDADRRDEVFGILSQFLCEANKDTFHLMLHKVRKSCMFDNEEFYKYFRVNFLDRYRYKKWARCYTTGELDFSWETFVRVLKQCYLQAMECEGDVMRLILGMFTDKLCDWSRESKRKVARKVAIIGKKHRTSLGMSRSRLRKVNNCSWVVLASPTNEQMYLVRKVGTCSTCELVCEQCDSCMHEYMCSCRHSAMRYNMCVHIHLVARDLLKSEGDDTEEECVDSMEEDEEEEEEDDEEEDEEETGDLAAQYDGVVIEGNEDAPDETNNSGMLEILEEWSDGEVLPNETYEDKFPDLVLLEDDEQQPAPKSTRKKPPTKFRRKTVRADEVLLDRERPSKSADELVKKSSSPSKNCETDGSKCVKEMITSDDDDDDSSSFRGFDDSELDLKCGAGRKVVSGRAGSSKTVGEMRSERALLADLLSDEEDEDTKTTPAKLSNVKADKSTNNRVSRKRLLEEDSIEVSTNQRATRKVLLNNKGGKKNRRIRK